MKISEIYGPNVPFCLLREHNGTGELGSMKVEKLDYQNLSEKSA